MAEQEQSPKKMQVQVSNTDLQKMKLESEDVDFIADCKTALLSKTTPLAKEMIYFLMLFIIIGITWAGWAKLEEVTRGMGTIIPASKVQLIQNLEGGILEKIYVQEGDKVKQGQVLAQLSKVQFAAAYKEVNAKFLAYSAITARLQAEISGQKTIKFPDNVKKKSALVTHETALFKSRMLTRKNMLKNLRANYKLALRELNITAPLVAKGVLSKIELLRLKRDVTSIKTKIDEFNDSVKEKALAELTQHQAMTRVLSEQLTALKDRMTRTTIKAPVNGIVKQIYINTVGGVIQPGVPIMDIVPFHDKLIVEAQVKPEDIAFIKVGQKATVRITAYDYSIYGSLPAAVTHVSADASTDKYGNSFYQVDLKTDKSYLGSKQGSFPLKPGMSAMVDIITGKKSVLTYLLKPLMRAKIKAMRER
jgi:membrane fusion protein, adhesin transport system